MEPGCRYKKVVEILEYMCKTLLSDVTVHIYAFVGLRLPRCSGS